MKKVVFFTLFLLGVFVGVAEANDCKARCSGLSRVCQNIEYCVQQCGLAGVWGQNCYRRGRISYVRCSAVYRTCYPRPHTAALLGGTYKSSCRACFYRKGKMCCSCRDQAGKWKHSCVPAQCLNPVSNCDGKLLCSAQCDQPSLLSGSYQRSCTKCFFYRSSMCCRCRAKGGRWKTSCVSGACTEPVSNCEGRLTCSATCPNGPLDAWQLRGPYKRSCRDCAQHKGQMCCRCRSRGSWVNYSCVKMSCRKLVVNCGGQLRCGACGE